MSNNTQSVFTLEELENALHNTLQMPRIEGSLAAISPAAVFVSFLLGADSAPKENRKETRKRRSLLRRK